jgi:hypothetical protein
VRVSRWTNAGVLALTVSTKLFDGYKFNAHIRISEISG